MYKLLTVIYGTKSAPYLATRVLKQMCLDEAANFPSASRVGLTDFYVDDILTYADDLQSAMTLQTELIQMLRSGGMELRKWCSNDAPLLKAVHKSETDFSFMTMTDTVKTLGLGWNPGNDYFHFSIKTSSPATTKRTIISEIARLFDPCGLVGPVMAKAKIFYA